jgi:hypothetical protein
MRNYRALLSVLILSAGIYLTGCNFSGNDEESQTAFDSTAVKDSAEIVEVLKNTYQWYETRSKLFDFTLKYQNGICVGVDQEAEKNRVAELQQTNLFDPAFIETYNRISAKIDASIKSDTVKYYEGDGMELEWISADPWCNCQDSPEKYWETLTIKEWARTGDEATVKWTWGDDFVYTVKLRKTEGVWKISSLEGFDKILATNTTTPQI